MHFSDVPNGNDLGSQFTRSILAHAAKIVKQANQKNAVAGNIGRVVKGWVPAGRAPYGYLYKVDKEIGPNGRAMVKKAWWENHPDYLKEYRREHPEYVARDNEKRKMRHQRSKKRRADIHTAISTQPAVMKELKYTLVAGPNADIHTALMEQLVIISLFSYHYLARGCADIHPEIASPPPPSYRRAHDYQTNPYS